MCLCYYHASKPRKSSCACTTHFPDSGTKFKKAGLFMKDLLQYLFMQDLLQYNRQLLGPLLFNIFITNDIFLFAKNSTLYDYADNNAQFSCEKPFDQEINNLQTDLCTLKVWFYDNFLVLSPKKCHFVTLANGNNLCNL